MGLVELSDLSSALLVVLQLQITWMAIDINSDAKVSVPHNDHRRGAPPSPAIIPSVSEFVVDANPSSSFNSCSSQRKRRFSIWPFANGSGLDVSMCWARASWNWAVANKPPLNGFVVADDIDAILGYNREQLRDGTVIEGVVVGRCLIMKG